MTPREEADQRVLAHARELEAYDPNSSVSPPAPLDTSEIFALTLLGWPDDSVLALLECHPATRALAHRHREVLDQMHRLDKGVAR